MKLAPLALLLAACSSPATTTTTHPGDDVYVAIDAAPTPVAVTPPDAEPVGVCFGEAELDRVADGAPVVCNFVEDEETSELVDDCYVVRADGTTEGIAATPPRYPEAHLIGRLTELPASGVLSSSSVEAEVCTAAGVCKNLTPKLEKGQDLADVAVDVEGKRAALAIHGAGAHRVEIWDVAKATVVAKAELPGAHRQVEEVALLDGMVLIKQYDDEAEEMRASVWKIAGKKLTQVAAPEGDLFEWTGSSPGHVALALGDDLVILDLATGKVLGSTPWTAILDDAQRAARDPDLTELDLKGTDDEIGVLVTQDDDDDVEWALAAGTVKPMTGGAVRAPIRPCPVTTDDDDEEDGGE